MMYSDDHAGLFAKVWKVSPETRRRWARTGIIPDIRALQGPLDEAGKSNQAKLIKLIETGWLKARPLSRMIDPQWRDTADKINALMTAHRNPDDSRFHVRSLYAQEMAVIKKRFDLLEQKLLRIVHHGEVAPARKPLPLPLQAELRALLQLEEVDTVNLRRDMDEKQVARFWSFVRGRGIKRDLTDLMLPRLKEFLVLLTVPADQSGSYTETPPELGS